MYPQKIMKRLPKHPKKSCRFCSSSIERIFHDNWRQGQEVMHEAPKTWWVLLWSWKLMPWSFKRTHQTNNPRHASKIYLPSYTYGSVFFYEFECLVWCFNPNPTPCRASYFLNSQPPWNPRRNLKLWFHPSLILHQKIKKLKKSTIIHSFYMIEVQGIWFLIYEFPLCPHYYHLGNFYDIMSNDVLHVIMVRTPRAPCIISIYFYKFYP